MTAAMDLLTEILRPARLTEVVDVGANPIDGAPPYKRMLDAGLCRVTGFEPQPEALARLQARTNPLERYLPHCLGDGTARRLNVCALEGMTSLKVPDPAHLALFNLFPIWGDVKAHIDVSTKRLDDVSEIAAMDLLKMDVQGSERDVLEHGRARLADTVAIQTEVSFVTLYENQPTIGEMDTLLRNLGFLPHCFAELKVWPLAPTIVSGQPNKGLRQLLEADLVYVRDFTKPENMTAEQWKQLALIAHHCYGSVDLAARCLNMLASLGAVPDTAAEHYLSNLGKPN